MASIDSSLPLGKYARALVFALIMLLFTSPLAVDLYGVHGPAVLRLLIIAEAAFFVVMFLFMLILGRILVPDEWE